MKCKYGSVEFQYTHHPIYLWRNTELPHYVLENWICKECGMMTEEEQRKVDEKLQEMAAEHEPPLRHK